MTRKLKLVLGLSILLVLAIYIYISDPSQGPILPCYFKYRTGYQCPGCGMTRALNSLMHFRFREAYGYNNLIIVIPLGIIVELILYFRKKNREAYHYFLAFLGLIYGIYRNIK